MVFKKVKNDGVEKAAQHSINKILIARNIILKGHLCALNLHFLFT